MSQVSHTSADGGATTPALHCWPSSIKHLLCRVWQSGTVCLMTLVHSRIMCPSNGAWKLDCSLVTIMHSALETMWQCAIQTYFYHYHIFCSVPIDSIRTMMIVWRLWGKIIRSALYTTVVYSDAHMWTVFKCKCSTKQPIQCQVGHKTLIGHCFLIFKNIWWLWIEVVQKADNVLKQCC